MAEKVEAALAWSNGFNDVTKAITLLCLPR